MEAIIILVGLLSFAFLMYCWGAFDDMIEHFIKVREIRKGWKDSEE